LGHGQLGRARGCKTSRRPVVVGDAYKKFIAKQVEKARN
jgi:hypothetical protein